MFAQADFATDIKVPGMVHGRMIRPAVAGAVPVKVDESSIKDIPSAKVVWDKGFLGVVADKEWDAIKATRAAQGRVVETPVRRSPIRPALYDHIRKAPTRKREVGKHAGDVDAAFKTAARVIEAEYEWPFQSHARMGPACALVDIKDGHATCWSGTQKAHFVQTGRRRNPANPAGRRCTSSGPRVRAPMAAATPTIARRTPRFWPRPSASRCACNTCAIRAPAGTRRRPPRSTRRAPRSMPRATSSPTTFLSKGFSRVDVDTNGSQPRDTLAGQDLGVALKSGDGFGFPGDSYGFANKRTAWETIAPLLDRASPLRTAHMRDPVGPQIHFASESFIDELAAALKVDPVEFRLRYVRDPRDIAVIKAAAEKAGWQSRPSPRNDQRGDKVTGRGIAYAQRGPTRVAVIAEVDVDRSTGKIWARKFTVAHDCGQIINPDGLHHAIENNIVQATEPHAVGRGQVR